ncbi:MAG: motility protein MotB [Gammaproteobacteria bacterium]|nr:MAG: motility protein MotB [Gammaproteobacteria bacterium]
MEKGTQSIIIVKKKGHGHGHHGGGWKVALADFMTAMMAFFMLMWLLGSTSKEEQKAISGYFNDPGSEFAIGEGGSNPGLIEMQQPQAESHSDDPQTEDKSDHDNSEENTQTQNAEQISEAKLKKELERIEKEQLEQLQTQVQDEINKDPIFQQMKDQILIDLTALGLRIQIVDKDQRPGFDVGSAHMKPYIEDVLKSLAPLLDKVQNKISVTGHTDSTSYGAGATYTNWELSADRANSARRALLQGGFPEGKVVTVQGMGSAAPLIVDKPDAPINRRIAIIVLKKAVADALSNGGTGLNSNDLIKSSDSPDGEPKPHIMTQKEVDAAIDAGR